MPAGVVERPEEGALAVGSGGRYPHGMALLAPDLCQRGRGWSAHSSPETRWVLQEWIVRAQGGFLVKPVQDPLRCRHGLGILAVAQIMPGTALPGAHHPMPRADADREAALQQRLQVTQGPRGEWEPVGLWSLLERVPHKSACRRIQRRWATTP